MAEAEGTQANSQMHGVLPRSGWGFHGWISLFPVEVRHGGNGRCGRTRDDWRPVRVQRRRRPMSHGRRRRNWGAAAGTSAEVTRPVSRRRRRGERWQPGARR